jgi:hypothetical protein
VPTALTTTQQCLPTWRLTRDQRRAAWACVDGADAPSTGTRGVRGAAYARQRRACRNLGAADSPHDGRNRRPSVPPDGAVSRALRAESTFGLAAALREHEDAGGRSALRGFRARSPGHLAADRTTAHRAAQRSRRGSPAVCAGSACRHWTSVSRSGESERSVGKILANASADRWAPTGSPPRAAAARGRGWPASGRSV